MISLTKEITTYFSAEIPYLRLTKTTKKKKQLPTLNFETTSIGLPQICVYTLKLV